MQLYYGANVTFVQNRTIVLSVNSALHAENPLEVAQSWKWLPKPTMYTITDIKAQFTSYNQKMS